ncbi:hypothetical protein D3C71_1950050 [compost metagenome]
MYRKRLKEKAAIHNEVATDAVPVQLTARIDECCAAIPPIPAAAAMLNCKTDPKRLSIIPAASGAAVIRLYCIPGPDAHAANAHNISKGTVTTVESAIVDSSTRAIE